MNTPHDHLFKSTFSDVRIARDYIQNFLPARLTSKLDLSSLKLSANSYVDTELKESLSDVVYTCTYGEESLSLALLFEHKSSPDGIIHLQLLSYMLGFWKQQPEKKKGLSIVIPIVVYHGRQTWKKRTFTSHFSGLDDTLRPFIPNFEYLLTDLKDWSDEALMTLQAGLVKNLFLILKHFKDVQYIQRYIDRLFWGAEPYLDDASQKKHIEVFWKYLYLTNEHKQVDFRKLTEKLSTSLREEAMTIYEHAVQKGEKKGSIEQQNLFISNLLNEGFDLPTIARLTSLTEKEVTDRIKELGLEK